MKAPQPVASEPHLENGSEFSFESETAVPEETFQDRRQEPRRSIIGYARLILGTDDEDEEARFLDCAVLEFSSRGRRVAIRPNLERDPGTLVEAMTIPEIDDEVRIEFPDRTRHRAVIRWVDTNELGIEIMQDQSGPQ